MKKKTKSKYNDFKHLSEEFSGHLLELVKQKGEYPDEYMDSFFLKKIDKQLPDRSKFFSSLKDESISEKDYLHAINVWNMLKRKTMGDYHDLCLKTDVLLIAVFEKIINTWLEYYGLDFCHCFSSPGLSWHAMLIMTEIELKLISNIDMYLFVERGMRAVISYIAKRFSEVNSKYMKSYDNSKPSKYIMCLDANNLYGWAMGQ